MSAQHIWRPTFNGTTRTQQNDFLDTHGDRDPVKGSQCLKSPNTEELPYNIPIIICVLIPHTILSCFLPSVPVEPFSCTFYYCWPVSIQSLEIINLLHVPSVSGRQCRRGRKKVSLLKLFACHKASRKRGPPRDATYYVRKFG